jgi:hypothetical protein
MNVGLEVTFLASTRLSHNRQEVVYTATARQRTQPRLITIPTLYLENMTARPRLGCSRYTPPVNESLYQLPCFHRYTSLSSSAFAVLCVFSFLTVNTLIDALIAPIAATIRMHLAHVSTCFLASRDRASYLYRQFNVGGSSFSGPMVCVERQFGVVKAASQDGLGQGRRCFGNDRGLSGRSGLRPSRICDCTVMRAMRVL